MSTHLLRAITFAVGVLVYGSILLIAQHLAAMTGYWTEIFGFTEFRGEFAVAACVYFAALILFAFTIPSLFAREAAMRRQLLAVSAMCFIVVAGFCTIVSLVNFTDALGP